MKALSDKICVFTVIENSKTNIGAGKAWQEWDKTNPTSEPLEEEAIECFKSWRKNAGWLKDIDIYCVCPSDKKPSMDTIIAIKSLNVHYIEHYFPQSEKFDCGYMNVPLVGNWFETHYCSWAMRKYDHIIHIDLDMTVINTIPPKYFDNMVTIGSLEEHKPWCYCNTDFPNLESCFIISSWYSSFYYYWYNCFIPSIKKNKIPDKYQAEIEEFALDLMYQDMLVEYDVEILSNQYQIGERYPIRDDIDLKKILFHHNHHYESPEVLTEYVKMRLNKLK